MKRTMRRILAVCLVLMLALSMLPMSVLALTDASTGSIVISGLTGTDADASTGVAVSVYRVMDVVYNDETDQPEQPIYVWETPVAAWISANFPAYIDTANANAVTEAFYSLDSDTVGYGTDLAVFYDELAGAIKAGTITLAPAATGTGNCTLASLPMGNYLVLIENGMKIYRPSTVNLIPVWSENDSAWKLENATVVIKASEPAVTKTMQINGQNKDEAKVGDTITYTVSANVPVYPANALAKGYQIGDKLPAGVTLNDTSITVVGVKEGQNDVTLEAGADKGYTLTSGAGTETDNGTAVDFLLSFNYENIRGFDSVTVTYTATVNSSAALGADGNANNAYLGYNNNPYDAGSWKEKDASDTFYSFGIQVNKLDEKGDALPGAEFSLSISGENTPLTFLKDEENNRYYLSSEAGSSAVLAVDSNGVLNIHGLVSGSYVLTETKAPDGYVKLQNPVTVTLTESTETPGALAVQSDDIAVTAKADGVMEIDIPNVKGFSLPVTGGAGIMLFGIFGVVMMGGGVLLILAVLRKWKRAC